MFELIEQYFQLLGTQADAQHLQLAQQHVVGQCVSLEIVVDVQTLLLENAEDF